MRTRWLSRLLIVVSASLAVMMGAATAAHAVDRVINLDYVADMTFIDKGDYFYVQDSERDGRGPTGYLYVYSDHGGRDLVKKKHNGEGYGSTVSFKYNVREGYKYLMELCQKGHGCDSIVLKE